MDAAGKIGEKDWTPLARALGFNKQEIQDVKKKYPHRSREQVYQVFVAMETDKGTGGYCGCAQTLIEELGIGNTVSLFSLGANVIYLSPVGILGCKQATYLIVLRAL